MDDQVQDNSEDNSEDQPEDQPEDKIQEKDQPVDKPRFMGLTKRQWFVFTLFIAVSLIGFYYLPLLGIVATILTALWYVDQGMPSLFKEDPDPNLDEEYLGIKIRQWRHFWFVFVLGMVGVVAHSLRNNQMFDSAALYVGVPFLLALGMCFIPKAKSRVGATFKGLTIALFLSFPLFNEGVICVLMASPIFYTIALISAWSHDRHENNRKGGTLQLAIVTSVLALASLEGVHDNLSFDRTNTVSYSKIVDADIDDLRRALAQMPDFDLDRPFATRLFPLPVHIEGSGLDVGDERRLDFEYNKWVIANTHKGSTTFRIVQSTPNYIAFDIPHDDSYLSHYLKWTASEVFLEPVNDNKTKITWALSYERTLDPVWYFGPMQKYIVTKAAKTLVDDVADTAL